MHPDRVIVRKYRQLDGLSTRPYDQHTLTRQSDDTNDAPRDPLHGPVTWNPVRTRPYSTLPLRLCLRLQSVTITASSASLNQETDHCIRYPTLARSSASAVLCLQPFPTRLDSSVFRFDLTQFFFDLTVFNCFSV